MGLCLDFFPVKCQYIGEHVHSVVVPHM